jgi:hypothetical protein
VLDGAAVEVRVGVFVASQVRCGVASKADTSSSVRSLLISSSVGVAVGVFVGSGVFVLVGVFVGPPGVGVRDGVRVGVKVTQKSSSSPADTVGAPDEANEIAVRNAPTASAAAPIESNFRDTVILLLLEAQGVPPSARQRSP